MTDVIATDRGAQDNGLAAMLRDLLSQNMANHPERLKDVAALDGNIVIAAPDIDVRLTLACRDGRITVYDGERPPYKLRIETNSDNILKLSTLKIKAGLPYYFDRTGREVLALLFRGKLRIEGLFKHPLLLTHITKLFSVY